MTDRETREFAGRVIREEFTRRGIEVKRLILFGSRARGEARPDSDWDFLVVTNRPLGREEISEIRLGIVRHLARHLIDAELIVHDEETYNKQRSNTGMIIYYAAKEGVMI